MSDEGRTKEPEEYYDKVEVFGKDSIEDPFDEAETDIALEMLVESDGGEVPFASAWDAARGMIRNHTDKGEHNVAAHQLLELERACYDEGSELPEDFKYEFHRAFDMLAVDVMKCIAHGDYDSVVEVFETLEGYGKDSKVVDRILWLELSTSYNNAIETRRRYLAMKDPEMHAETIEVKGPEILRDMYDDLLSREQPE